MVIAWSSVSGASGYNVYRGSSKVNASPVTATSYTDTGLAPGTSYSWTVTAVAAGSGDSPPSAPATGTTTGASAVCFSASNYAHTTAGRAHQIGGITYANGSNQNMGLWNLFVTTTLKQTGANFYVIGTCP
jgi:fibronectin type 3 domain-containing protein